MSRDFQIPESVAWHASTAQQILSLLQSQQSGLPLDVIHPRQQVYGPNTLPERPPVTAWQFFLRQFKSPLIYILGFAAIVSVFIQEWADAIFISLVLLLNALIGTIQEYSAERAATSLKSYVTQSCRVIRNGDTYVISTLELVPGDIVLLESGDRVAADIRLLETHDLEINESLLTGESASVHKDARTSLRKDTFLAERSNMAFAGTTVLRGRARGIVVTTALQTELGKIAASLAETSVPETPLQQRMRAFTHGVALAVLGGAIILGLAALAQGVELATIFLVVVALAVSAIPEGLPVALTVALSIGMRRMAQRHVIIRRLLAVEALGSSTYIATDKTGTLTINELTATKIFTPDGEHLQIRGSGMTPEGDIVTQQEQPLNTKQQAYLQQICLAAILPNEAFIGHRNSGWSYQGDAVDVALLVMAHKAGLSRPEVCTHHPELANIPFESERLFAASLNTHHDQTMLYIKGAVEKLLPMCTDAASTDGRQPLNEQTILKLAHQLANEGYRVMAVASGPGPSSTPELLSETDLRDLTFLGLITMIDPLREDVEQAISRCRAAGIQVAMLTGDHPATAFTIARQLGLAQHASQVVTGKDLANADNAEQFASLIADARVFARIDPGQKLDIVEALQHQGHYVAVSGDGANDAPALSAAHVGIAMGKSGTDVAREMSDIVLTNDNFSAIVDGIEEGRIAYSNVRKVIFLLVSTGAAEVVLFTLAILTGQPLPLLAVQLLWLNLVTNGIQDIALAFEPGEGNELQQPPRPPAEPVFNRIMLERIAVAALVIGVTAFAVFQWLLYRGFSVDEARNSTVLLMVLFENLHVFNCRSEKSSIFTHNPLRNRILLFGTMAAQCIHIAAMYTPGLSDILHLTPVSFAHWSELLLTATVIVVALELHKQIRRWRTLPAS